MSTDDTTWTDHDTAMCQVMTDMEQVREWLARHAAWFHAEWEATRTTDPVPFYEIIERPTREGAELSLVFVLRRITATQEEISAATG